MTDNGLLCDRIQLISAEQFASRISKSFCSTVFSSLLNLPTLIHGVAVSWQTLRIRI